VAQSFDIKSSQLPLVALVLKTPDTPQLIRDIVSQFGPGSDSPDFFDQDPLVLDFSALGAHDTSKDVPALLAALVTCRLRPMAFRQANPLIATAALKAGLVEAPPEVARGAVSAKKGAQKHPPTAPQNIVHEVVKEVTREVIKEVVREVPGPATMVIDKPLRSGQKIYARGADLVLLAMVNMGAEVVADGNIHVYAPLRGKAMAGASGNTQARIFSLCLEPELISIAGVYRTSENPLPADVQGKPAQVRLSNDGQDKLLFEALKS